MPDGLLQNYINGQFVPSSSSETIDLISPVDESVVGRAPVSNAADVDAAVAAAERAFATWGRTTPSVRQQALLKLADAIEEHCDEIVEAQCRNTGQLKAMISAEEVMVSADQVRFFAGAARMVEGLSAGEYMEGFTSYVRREPIGVVGQVTPWNYPFMMALWKIGPALAAGNTIVLKPSDTTPGSTLVLAKLSKGILPDGVFNVVLGNGGTGAMGWIQAYGAGTSIVNGTSTGGNGGDGGTNGTGGAIGGKGGNGGNSSFWKMSGQQSTNETNSGGNGGDGGNGSEIGRAHV